MLLHFLNFLVFSVGKLLIALYLGLYGKLYKGRNLILTYIITPWLESSLGTLTS